MKRPVLFLAAALFLLAGNPSLSAPSGQAAGNAQSQAPQTVTIPFTYDPPAIPLMIAMLSIDGHDAMPFIVDTGASPPISITPETAQELGLQPDTSGKQKDPVVIGWVKLKNVYLEGESADEGIHLNFPDPMPVIDLGVLATRVLGMRVAGIIGIPVLSHFPCRFDFAAKTITFFVGQRYTPPSGSVSLPLRPVPDSDLLAVPVTLSENTSVDLKIDTGSPGTKAPLESAAGLRPAAVSSSGTASLYGAYLTPEYLLPEIRLGDMVVDDAVVDFLPPNFVQKTLGLDILSLFPFTLDSPDRKLILEKPYTSHPYASRRGWTGIRGGDQGKGIVDYVESGSPAEKAGIKKGDQIFSVDGHDTAGLPTSTVGDLIAGLMGTTAHIQALRDGGTLSFVFLRGDEFAEPAGPVDGLAIAMIPGQPFTILSVAPGCAGEKAGLKVQDKILSVNGIPTTTMKLEQISDTILQDHMDLSIQRAGESAPLSIHLASK